MSETYSVWEKERKQNTGSSHVCQKHIKVGKREGKKVLGLNHICQPEAYGAWEMKAKQKNS